MFTLKWIRAMAVFVFLVLGLPCLAQNAGSGYDRMDGDYIKPSTREQPKRNFNNTAKERLNIYKVKRSANSRAGTEMQYVVSTDTVPADDSHESRRAKDRSVAVEGDEGTEIQLDEPADAVATEGEGSESDEGLQTTEAVNVVSEEVTPEVLPSSSVDPNQMVFCSKRLMEFHWDQECSMLKNVKPTRLTYSDAKEAHYTKCTACGGKR